MSEQTLSTLSGPQASPQDLSVRSNARDRVTSALREALIIGRIQPGLPMTLRGLADQLGVSPMPVREAIRGLAAERAIDISASGRITVPRLDQKRITEILDARALLEPRAAALALPNIDRECLRQLKRIDDEIDVSLSDGNVERYMVLNHAFHFAIYERSLSDVFLPLIESVWLRFGPFMRMVYGRVGTTGLVDHHKQALEAAARGDAAAFAEAIRLDISEGMELIGDAVRDAEVQHPPPRRRRKIAAPKVTI
ncbi:GntR family transcriptional regulator [Oryzibacter oryziterrae]|uniref:GntR family transcriptional regulator n=1 Tax=Oryzibacter oryziterrae TaxID=2766474 RepID=UPI001F20C64D|nr:GntR family transcriptional regulator [Oryzibacter oryziterrae]